MPQMINVGKQDQLYIQGKYCLVTRHERLITHLAYAQWQSRTPTPVYTFKCTSFAHHAHDVALKRSRE